MDTPTVDLILPHVNEESRCLPLSVNTVSRYWDVEIPISEAERLAERYPSSSGGILMEGIELAESRQLRCAILRSDVAELKRTLDAGAPPIVMLPGLYDITQHASVISGYDDAEGVILHHIPQTKDKDLQVGAIPESKFEQLWAEECHLMIVIAPSEILGPIRLDAGESERLCLESERAIMLGDTKAAMALLESAIKQDESNPLAHLLYGSVLNDSDSDRCMLHYQRCIKLNPRCYLAYRGMGNFYLKSAAYEKAEQGYSKAIDINPTRFGPIYKNRGIARIQQKKNEQAKADLQEYLRLVRDAPDKKSIQDAIDQL